MEKIKNQVKKYIKDFNETKYSNEENLAFIMKPR